MPRERSARSLVPFFAGLLVSCGGSSDDQPAAVSLLQDSMRCVAPAKSLDAFRQELAAAGIAQGQIACGYENLGNTTADCSGGQQWLYLVRIQGAQAQQARAAGFQVVPDFKIDPGAQGVTGVAPKFIMFDCSLR